MGCRHVVPCAVPECKATSGLIPPCPGSGLAPDGAPQADFQSQAVGIPILRGEGRPWRAAVKEGCLRLIRWIRSDGRLRQGSSPRYGPHETVEPGEGAVSGPEDPVSWRTATVHRSRDFSEPGAGQWLEVGLPFGRVPGAAG